MDIETFAIEISEGFKPKEDLNVHTWAEKYRIVTEPSPFPGRWKTPPYQREPMEMISKIGINKIVLMWASQLGKSELLNNSIFWSICEKPSPIMFVMPTQELAESYSRTRIDPIIDSTPNIRRLVAQKKSRSSDNTITEKMFPGGSLYFCSAASPSALSSRPISMLLMDEIDRMEDDIAEEGSPIELAAKRCTNFWNHKIILTSTPLILGTSKVSHEYDQTDQRKFFVPCPHCNSYQTMDFERLKWDPLKYETVKYQCNKCEQFWTEKERKNVIAKGEWRPTATPKAKGAIGYQLNILYSFLCKGFEVAAEDWDKAKGVMARERVFFNTRLGLPFDESAAYEAIYNRVPNLEEYWDVLPFEACIITCAVDVQDDRLELEVMAWQENHENFGLEYKVIQGDPSLNDVWLQLYLNHFQRFLF